MSGIKEHLSAIDARAKSQPAYSWPHEAQEDRAYLLTLARKQADALEAVMAACDATDVETSEPLQADLVERIRAALEPSV